MKSYAHYKCRRCDEQFKLEVYIHMKSKPGQFLPILMQNNGGADFHLCKSASAIVGVADLIGGSME